MNPPNLNDIERLFQEKLNAMTLAMRTELLNVLMTPDHERARLIGEFWASPRTREFGELLIDLEESPAARPVLLGMLRERQLRGSL